MRARAQRLSRAVEAGRSRLAGLGSDLAVLGALSAVVLLVAMLLDRSGQVPVGEGLILLTVAAAIAAAVLLTFVARLAADPRAARVASALLVLGFVVFPLTVIEFAEGAQDVSQLVRDLALIGTTGLFVWSAARRPTPGHVWPAAAVVTASVLALAGLLGLFPRLHPSPGLLDIVEYGARLAWVVAGIALVVAGSTRDSPLLRRVGLAMSTIGVLVVITFQPLPELIGPVLWFSGTAMALFSVLILAGHTISSVTRAHRESQARASVAESAAESAREHRHELRNVVAGLSGAASVLYGADVPAADQERLRSAAHAELERLRQMLEHTESAGAAGRPSPSLDTVRRDLAALHRGSGAEITTEIAPGLASPIPADVVAQAVQNLLRNCERHAPGAAVTVRATRAKSGVLVEVVDDGPGLSVGSASSVLRRGFKRSGSPGDGLGLHITRELLAEYGGDVRVEPARPGVGGCRAVVTLPVATVADLERASA